MNRLFASLTCLAALCMFFSCSSNEIGNSKDVNPESIYFDYQVRGEETQEDITVVLQYRFAGRHGTTLLLDEPSQVELDGQAIKADSSRMTGAFYEMAKPKQVFTGKHSIIFTNLDKKQYREDFSFTPMVLKTVIPASLGRQDIALELDGMDSLDFVRVVLNDTSFLNPGINQLDTVRNGRLVISEAELKNVANGPIHLDLFRDHEKPVKNGTPEGGTLYMSYVIRRNFILHDTARP